MATDYKILGQAQASAASGTEMLNGFPDPNFGFYTSSTQHNGDFSGPVYVTTGTRNDSHQYQRYGDGFHHPGGGNAGRTDTIQFYNHHHGNDVYWNLKSSTAPFLQNGRTYTLSFWIYADGTTSGHRHNQVTMNRGVNNQDLIPWDSSAHQFRMNQNWGTPTHSNAWGTWKQYYTTFTGEGGNFNLYFRAHNNSHHNGDNNIYFGGVQLLEGAVPFALLNSKPLDGTSGNPNALYTAPFTTRSEGWQATAFASPTVRRLTGAWVTLYTVPDLTQAVASTISVTNIAPTGTTYRIAVQKFGESLSHKHLIAFDQVINGNSNENMTVGLTLGAGDRIIVQSDTDKVTFSVFGSEITL